MIKLTQNLFLLFICLLPVMLACESEIPSKSLDQGSITDLGADLVDYRNNPSDMGFELEEDSGLDATQALPDMDSSSIEDAMLPLDAELVIDDQAPTWPSGATVFAENIQSREAQLAWSHALDNRGVSFYRVYQMGSQVAQVPGNQSSYTTTALQEGLSYTYGVVAEDEAGNRSEMLTLTFMTTDQSLPTWSDNAFLRVVDVDESVATLTWASAMDNVSISRYRVLVNGQLTTETAELTTQLDNLTAVTNYQVEVVAIDGAGNTSLGNPTAQFTTIDSTPPQFASEATLVLHEQTPRQVRVSWQAAIDNVAVEGYEIYLDGAQLGRVDVSNRTYTVQGLIAGTEVTILVRAFDAAGNMSDHGPSVTFNTGDDVSPIWPAQSALRASDVTPNTLTLAWTAAIDDVGVSAYVITQNGQVLGESTESNFAVAQLMPWTDYNFTVRARDAVGNVSLETLSLDLKTPDIQPPMWDVDAQLNTLTVSPNSVTLSWPAAYDDVSVVAYEVFQDGALLGRIDSETTEYTVIQLNPWTEYDFQVAAIDQADNRSVIDLSLTQRTTDEQVPTWSDQTLTVSDLTPSSLHLAWTAATDDVAVTTYVVRQDGVELSRLDGSTREFEVNGLAPWTTYVFTVWAEDAAGNVSAQVPTVTLQTPDIMAPTFPVDAVLTTLDVTSTSVTVRWPAAGDDVAVTRYELALDGIVQPTIDGQTTEVQLSNLRPMWAHLIAVRAYDAAGNSSNELVTSINTPDGGPPTWNGVALNATAGINEVQLSWGAASDDVMVVAYRVFQDGVKIYEGPERSWLADSLVSETTYLFSVEAGDAAGHWSNDGPTAEVTTAKGYDPGFKRLTRQQFLNTTADLLSRLMQDICSHPVNLVNRCGDPNHWQYRKTTYEDVMEDITNRNGSSDYLRSYPHDEAVGGDGPGVRGFRRLDSVVYDDHISSWFSALMNQAESWKHGFPIYSFWQGCWYDDNSIHGYAPFSVFEPCAEDFLDLILTRTWRRPPTAEEREALLNVYRNAGIAYANQGHSGLELFKLSTRNMLVTALLSPDYLYHVELGDENGRLTAWELANRLSYHFWNTMPDDELMAVAADGSLLTDGVYQQQVERLFNDPRSLSIIDEFWADFFEFDQIPGVEVFRQDGKNQVFYHAGSNDPNVNRFPQVGAAEGAPETMQMELRNLGRWFTSSHPGTFEDMFRSNLHFMTCPEVGECSAAPWSLFSYRIQGSCSDEAECEALNWSGTGLGWNGVDPPSDFPESQRAGLLTRMSMLAHNTVQARPIQRGLRIRELLLCDPVPPPENCDVVKPPQVTGMCESDQGSTGVSCSDNQHCEAGETCVGWDREVTMTVREKVEALTEVPGTSCAGCHSTLINGFGHAFGHFSSVGQYWEKEHMFTTQKNENGHFWYFIASPDQFREIDTSGTTVFNGQVISFDGPHEVADILVDSGRMEWCLSREYFRFALGRAEWESDEETIEELAQSMRDGATLADAFKAIAYTPQFKSLYKVTIASIEGDTP